MFRQGWDWNIYTTVCEIFPLRQSWRDCFSDETISPVKVFYEYSCKLRFNFQYFEKAETTSFIQHD